MSRVILITGANRGIGFSIAQGLASRAPQHELIIAARSIGNAESGIEELRKVGVENKLFPLALDITSDSSIKAAAEAVETKYGKLDVLINNAAIALIHQPGEVDSLRETYNTIFNTNVSGVAVTTSVFLPLLERSSDPRVIHVSSSRGSITRALSGSNPPTKSIPYSLSKTALNVVMFEYQNVYPNVLFHSTCPGHCKTGLNHYQGPRDPLKGAAGTVELAIAPRDKYKSGFWEMADDALECSPVPW